MFEKDFFVIIIIVKILLNSVDGLIVFVNPQSMFVMF